MKSYNIAGEEKLVAGLYAVEKDFWLKKLKQPGDFTKTYFPYDFKHYGRDNRPLETIPCRFSGPLEEKLIKASNGSDTRLHMILVSGLMQLLYKYSGHQDIVIGVPIYKQEVAGDYVNTALTLRSRIDAHMTFKNLLAQVRETIIEANEHANYPVENLPQDLDIPYSPGDDFPLFDAVVLLENIHITEEFKHIGVNIIFSFQRTDASLTGTIYYNPGRYLCQTVEQIRDYFNHLLQETLFNAAIAINDISILTVEEKQQLLYHFNERRFPYPTDMTIVQLFEHQAAATPNHIALVCAQQHISYRHLNGMANAIAGRLISKGIKNGDIVAIMGKRSNWIVALILGILKTGALYLPLNAKDPEARIRFILEDSKADLFVTERHLVKGNSVPGSPGLAEHILLKEDLEEETINGFAVETADNPAPQAKPPDTMYIIYTSGTTGTPKGVPISHRSVVNYIWWAAATYVKNEPVNFPLYTSIAFDLTVTSIFTPLVTGNAVVVYGGKSSENDETGASGEIDQAQIVQIIAENKVQAVKLTPSHLKLIRFQKIPGINANIKRLILGGEELETRLAMDIHENFAGNIEIYNEYGPTEATVGCMIHRFDPRDNRSLSVPIGVPAANTRIYLLNSSLHPVPRGAHGEIYIGGDGVAGGYLHRPTLTAEKFIANPFVPGETMYRTGDLARMRPDGYIEFTGRIDNQVKIRGYRIEIGEIEKRLSSHQQIKETAVIGRINESGEHSLCGYFVSDRDVSTPELKEYLSRELPDYMIPSYFVKIDKIPLTPNGKIDTRALPDPRTMMKNEYMAPRLPMEHKLVTIWSEILNIEESDLGITANFFEIGGHSLNATVLAARLHKEFNLKVPLTVIFKYPTILTLAEYLARADQDTFKTLKAGPNKSDYVLSSAQKRLYILQHRDKNNIAYNIPAVKVLEGTVDVDPDKLAQTFRELILRHESLRTSFTIVDNEPRQKIHNTFDFNIEYHDAPGGCRTGQIIKDFIRPFDLEKAPLLRVGLIKETTGRHILVFDMHHIITDGVSMNIFVTDFIALYSNKKLPALKLQYKDYSEWQQSAIEKNKIKTQEEYWLREFAGPIPRLILQLDFARPPVQAFEGNVLNFTIGSDKTALLNKLALENEVTLFMVLLSLFYVLIAKLSGQKDIVVGTGVEGRGHEDLRGIIGMFINTLALRNYPSGEKTFTSFLKEIKERTLAALENQDYQFEDLVEKLGLHGELGQNPLFDVMFQFENDNLAEIEINGLTLKPFTYDYNVSKFDLTLWTIKTGAEITCRMEYSTALFKMETVRWFIDYFNEIIDTVLASPQQPLAEIGKIREDEQKAAISSLIDDLENE